MYNAINYSVLKQVALDTDRLILRVPKRKDSHDMYAYASDPECSRYCLWNTHKSLSESYYFICGMIKENKQNHEINFAVEEKATGKMIGTISIFSFNPEHRLAEIGYSFAKKCWGHGYATEALNKLIEYAFFTLKLHRLEAQCDSRNMRSARVLQKCGFENEGFMRKRLYVKGEYADILFYGLVNENA